MTVDQAVGRADIPVDDPTILIAQFPDLDAAQIRMHRHTVRPCPHVGRVILPHPEQMKNTAPDGPEHDRGKCLVDANLPERLLGSPTGALVPESRRQRVVPEAANEFTQISLWPRLHPAVYLQNWRVNDHLGHSAPPAGRHPRRKTPGLRQNTRAMQPTRLHPGTVDSDMQHIRARHDEGRPA